MRSLILFCVVWCKPFVDGWGMLSDVREAMDHSGVVAMLVANIKAGALALSKAILKRTPGHSDVTTSHGCGIRLPVSVCLSSCSLFVAIIGSLSIMYTCYIVQASIDPDVQPGNLTDCQGHESSRRGTGWYALWGWASIAPSLRS